MTVSAESLGWLAGGGEMGALIRAKDWSATPLGPPETWPPSVKTAVRLSLDSRFPIILWIGPELRLIYNDSYIPFLGQTKHPVMLGAPGREAWGEIWPIIGPMHAKAQVGDATWVEDFQFFFDRRLPREEVYVTFSYSPIFADDRTAIEGTFCACTETTRLVIGERRLATLRGLGLRASEQRTVAAACQDAAKVLAANPLDVPFAAIYLPDPDGRTARCIAGTSLPSHASAFPPAQSLSGETMNQPWPFAEAAATGRAIEITDLPNQVGAFPTPLWPDLVETAFVVPLLAPGHSMPAGFLIAGVSPRRVLNADYRTFLDLVAEHVTTAILDARAFEDERRRAEALAEIDRAKTAFFSNVSHEFRSPLTLMMSPLEEILAKPEGELSVDGRALVTVAHRNSLRLLKLVNTLLDFSRIEAGRIQAAYVPTDLAWLTTELASNFQSACERAGLRLDIACEPLPEPVFVDRHMWEAIIFNLLSNAFKFTFEGSIAVRLAATPAGVRLDVRDTGVGIPAADLPRIFERFHRVESQRSRSYEGSGIGLALVQELVRLNGGTITVDSEVGRGTRFTVILPFGTAHLPAKRIGATQNPSSNSTRATAYVEEALRWLPDEEHGEDLPRDAQETPSASAVGSGRILLADDNADMRAYLVRLLSARGWEVEAVGDGQAALEAARRDKPDLVLSDVMMPRLGGLELADALRQDRKFTDVPVILLSARAGEEARVEGLETGADDYLVKPFAARELLARISSHLALSRLRRDAAERVRRSEARLKSAVGLVGLSPYSWDPQSGALEWDDRLRAMWGLRPDAHVDEDVFRAGLHPEDRVRVEAAIAACVDPNGDGVYALEYRVIGIEDRVERWVSTHGQTIFDEGRPVAFNGAALDITDRKRAEQRLRDSEERFRQFAEHSKDALWIRDIAAGRIEYLSPAFETIWGEPIAAMLGDLARFAQTIHSEDRERVLDGLERVKNGEAVVQEYRIVRDDGKVRWIRHTSFPIPDQLGRITRAGGIVQDITLHDGSIVYVVGANDAARQHVVRLLQEAGYDVKAFDSADRFLRIASALITGCLVLDMGSPAAGGLTIPHELQARGIPLPVIVAGPPGDVTLAVQAIKAGAIEWLQKPYAPDALLAAVATGMADIRKKLHADHEAEVARARIASMSPRELDVLKGLLAGGTNKSIANDLGISPRTVELHRAHVMERLGARNLPEAVLLAAAALDGHRWRLPMRPPRASQRTSTNA